MSHRTHCQNESKHEKYNELLTSFGKEIKKWAKGKKFPCQILERCFFEWKPISPALNADYPPPETTRVIGQEMGLKLSPTDKTFAPWLIVKKSEINKKTITGKKRKKVTKKDEEYDPELGLFAARQFHINDVITVCFGERAREGDTDQSRRLEVSPGKDIDVLADVSGKRPLYFGAHFANAPYIDYITAEDFAKYEKSNWCGKNANCQIEGCLIVCTSRIDKFDELRLDYGHRPRN